jgi:nucleoside 2-deoxyribosyltransferase
MMSFDAIRNSDLVLIEATEKGMGVGIEAGYAYGLGIPVVTVLKTGTDLSINLKSLSSKIIPYNDVHEIILN